MTLIKKILAAFSFVFLVASPVMAVATPQPAFAGVDCERPILLISPWYRGLTDNDCNIVSPDAVTGGLSGFIWRIVLNVIEIGLYLAGYVALFFVLYGGFLFLTGGANPSQIEKARKTLLNAVIGLAISISAIAAVNLIFRVING